MFSITGYFRLGSKFVGRMMTPQMSVVPSRPLVMNTSGTCHPAARRSVMSPFSSSSTTCWSLVRLSTVCAGRSTRDQLST